MPTLHEASLLAETRQRVADVMAIETALSVSNRYAGLIRLKELRVQTEKQKPPLIVQNTPGFLFVL